jgi:hypothetical protein
MSFFNLKDGGQIFIGYSGRGDLLTAFNPLLGLFLDPFDKKRVIRLAYLNFLPYFLGHIGLEKGLTSLYKAPKAFE